MSIKSMAGAVWDVVYTLLAVLFASIFISALDTAGYPLPSPFDTFWPLIMLAIAIALVILVFKRALGGGK